MLPNDASHPSRGVVEEHVDDEFVDDEFMAEEHFDVREENDEMFEDEPSSADDDDCSDEGLEEAAMLDEFDDEDDDLDEGVDVVDEERFVGAFGEKEDGNDDIDETENDDFVDDVVLNDVSEYDPSEVIEKDNQFVPLSDVEHDSTHSSATSTGSQEKKDEEANSGWDPTIVAVPNTLHSTEDSMSLQCASHRQPRRSPESKTSAAINGWSTRSGNWANPLTDQDETFTVTASEIGEEEARGTDASSIPSLAMQSMWDRRNRNRGNDGESDSDEEDDEEEDDEETATVMSTVITVADASMVSNTTVNRQQNRTFAASSPGHVYRLDGEKRELLEVTVEEDVADIRSSDSTPSTETKQQQLMKQRRRVLIRILTSTLCMLVFAVVAVVGGVVLVLSWDRASTQGFAPTLAPTSVLAHVKRVILTAMADLDVAASASTAASFEDESSIQSEVARYLAENANFVYLSSIKQITDRFVMGLFLQPAGFLDQLFSFDDICRLGGKESWSVCVDGNLTRLYFDDFTSVPMAIPPEVILLGQLEEIRLINSRFAGTLPGALGTALESLTTLRLQDNELTGSVPPLPLLQELHIGGNQFSSLPATGLAGLRHLRARRNRLTGPFVPSWVGPDLSAIDLSSNYLEGTIPSFCTGHSPLRRVELQGNQFTGTIPPDLYYLCSLQNLNIEGNSLVGPALPQPMIESPAMFRLALSGNKLTGNLSYIQDIFPSLWYLSLSRNSITGSLPPKLPEGLRTLLLARNSLTGRLWPDYLSRLKQLDVSDNRLTGTLSFLPYKTSSPLEYLDLSNNLFHGTVPRLLVPGSKGVLVHLNVSHNSLTGSLPTPYPSDLFETTRPIDFDVSWNQLNGTIPSELGEVPSFRRLLFHHNDGLRGTIPSSFGNLHRLVELNIEHTNITGDVSFLCRNDTVIKVDCEKVECQCCNEC